METDFFDILAGVLQGDTLAPFLIMIVLDYILRVSIDTNRSLGYRLAKARNRRYSGIKITDADYNCANAKKLLHILENASKKIGLKVNATNTEFINYQHYRNIKKHFKINN